MKVRVICTVHNAPVIPADAAFVWMQPEGKPTIDSSYYEEFSEGDLYCTGTVYNDSETWSHKFEVVINGELVHWKTGRDTGPGEIRIKL